jgi:NTP pyrophosphatase (non-canonical NTP hydrolase)
MDFDKYQKLARKTAVYPNIGNNYIYPTLGLASEAGELAGKIKKIIRDDEGKITTEKKKEIKKELGDVLWYLAQLSTELKISFSKIAKENIIKLSSRKRRNKLHGSGDNR